VNRFIALLVVGWTISSPGLAQDLKAPKGVPPLTGGYASSQQHPRVFMTKADVADLAARINVSGSYSARRFGQLAAQVTRDLASGKDWDAAYSGCNTDTYNYAFSYEPQTVHGDDHVAKVRSDMALASSATPPGGAAVVASRTALYAALVTAGAHAPKDAPAPAQAAALARRILVAWSAHGFRDQRRRFLNLPSQFCGGEGKFDEAAFTGVGLVVSRGIIYSVQAEDMLLYAGALGEADAKQIDAFHAAMFDLLRNALNYNFQHHAWPCDHYSNHAANQLAGLLALARLQDNRNAFEAVLNGTNRSIDVSLPWVQFFHRAIYGEADTPNECYPNKGPDGLTSRPFFQTRVVAPGEIDDRYRNSDPGQGIGYPMFTLERLYDAAEILRAAGFAPYGYRGSHRQSIEMATQYYSCLAKEAGFGGVLTAGNSRSCPDGAQYDGKIVSGVDRIAVIGALRFPNNGSIGALEAAAKAASSSGPFSLDAILFGKWRD
jgi:hypothetical protein